MISFKTGQKVAVVCGGEYDNKIIHITKEENVPDRNLEEEDIYDIIDDEDFIINKYKRFPVRDRLKLTKALKQNIEPLDDYLIDRYRLTSQKITEKLKKELDLTSGIMIILPNEGSERIFCAGKAGSGKSCLAALYAREYLSMFPKREVIIFTKHHKEKAYSLIKHKEILCDENLEIQPIDIQKQLSNKLIIFDDCDSIQSKPVFEFVRKLNNDLITCGRKYNIHVFTLGHLLMDYKNTRSQLNEANKVIFFNSGSNYHITRYLKVYAGLDPEIIKKITSLKSRWTMLNNSIPQYIIHEHGIFII